MFDAIKEWLSNIFGGASEHIDNVQQTVQEHNPEELQQQAGDAVQNATDKASEVKDQFTKQ